MSYPLRQSTAETILVGPFVDSAGAAVTSLTIAQADRKWKKFGSSSLANTSDTGNATHVAGGWYSMPVTTTDSDTLGPQKLSIQKSGALLYFETFEVLAPAEYDARFGHPLIRQAIQYGTAQSGSSLAIALATAASSTDDYYNGCIVATYAGAGARQARYAAEYTGSSRSITIDRAWVTNPDNTTKYVVLPFAGAATLAELADAVLDEAASGSLSAYNARPTLRQAIAELVLAHRNVTKSSNNLLTKDVDGTTTVRTRAMSPDATDPTSMAATA